MTSHPAMPKASAAAPPASHPSHPQGLERFHASVAGPTPSVSFWSFAFGLLGNDRLDSSEGGFFFSNSGVPAVPPSPGVREGSGESRVKFGRAESSPCPGSRV